MNKITPKQTNEHVILTTQTPQVFPPTTPLTINTQKEIRMRKKRTRATKSQNITLRRRNTTQKKYAKIPPDGVTEE